MSDFFHDETYNLESLELHSASGVGLSLHAVMFELNLFEDMYSPTMSDELIINDSNDLLSGMPMNGSEFIKVTFSKPGMSSSLTKIFRVYKVDNISPNYSNQANMTYVIKFCSEEMLLSVGTRISKSYRGMTISSMIQDIM